MGSETVHRHVFWRQFTDKIGDSSPTHLKTKKKRKKVCETSRWRKMLYVLAKKKKKKKMEIFIWYSHHTFWTCMVHSALSFVFTNIFGHHSFLPLVAHPKFVKSIRPTSWQTCRFWPFSGKSALFFILVNWFGVWVCYFFRHIVPLLW